MKFAHHALVLASLGSNVRYGLLTAAAYPGAEVDERAVEVGVVGRNAAPLIDLVLTRLG